MQFWNELEGKITEDGFRLGRLVRSEGRTAWFETTTQEAAPQPATISLTESLTDADEVTARLQAAQRLQHPNLMVIRKVGRARLDQALFVYALMEHADQNLADILRGQALSKEEIREVAEAIVSALSAIHQQGLVHGRVEPASILAVGEAVKLRSDCLQAPGGTRAGDIAGIGETLFQAFAQRKASSPEDPQINRIPAPFAEIVRNSLSARWGLTQIAAVLRPAPAAAISVPAMPRPPAPPAAPSTAAPGAKPPGGPPAPPLAGSVQPPPPPDRKAQTLPAQAGQAKESPATEPQAMSLRRDEKEEDDSGRESSGRSTAIYAAAAIVLLLILGWLVLRRKPGHPAGAVPSVAQSAPAAAPGSPASAAIPKPAASSAPHARSVWRVVAYTYHHQDQAQHKADEINHAHPGLNAAAYSPQGDSRHYLVVLGGAMDRHEALAMQQKARREGLAGDTYVQNFSE